MSELRTIDLKLPASTEDLAKLQLGDVVYLTGRVFTAREGVYKRAVEDGLGLPASREEMGSANFHCSPAASIEADGRYNVGAVTAEDLARLIEPYRNAGSQSYSSSTLDKAIEILTAQANAAHRYVSGAMPIERPR